MKTECIFCKIVRGEVPSYKIYEDTRTVVILDINPINKGHLLVLTKEHYDKFSETPVESIQEVMKVVYKTSLLLIKAYEADGFNIIINNNKAAGQVINHLHIHIIPRFVNDDVSFNWIPQRYRDDEIESYYLKIKKAWSE